MVGSGPKGGWPTLCSEPRKAYPTIERVPHPLRLVQRMGKIGFRSGPEFQERFCEGRPTLQQTRRNLESELRPPNEKRVGWGIPVVLSAEYTPAGNCPLKPKAGLSGVTRPG